MSNADVELPAIRIRDALWVLIAVLLAIVFGTDRVRRLHCRIYGHRWADEDRYGVEPVCITCSSKRAYNE